MESLTESLVIESRKLLDEVEELGGMTCAVEQGFPKQRIEEAAAIRQAKIDQGEEVIVGVNKYQTDESEQIEVREVDNTEVRNNQIQRLEQIRKSRDKTKVQGALKILEERALTGKGNLLEASIEAVRARATVGEISDALEKKLGPLSCTNQCSFWSLCQELFKS